MEKKAFGTHEVAKICRVTPATVGNWIDKGLMPTFTTGGGHRRIWADDLVKFLKSHNIPIPKELEIQSNIKILIVDDEPEIINLIKRIISQDFQEIITESALNGFEAGQKSIQFQPDLVILDMKLPGMDGSEVCRQIKANKDLAGTRILTISGQDPDEFGKKSIAAGADDFLAKPFSADELVEKIKKLI